MGQHQTERSSWGRQIRDEDITPKNNPAEGTPLISERRISLVLDRKTKTIEDYSLSGNKGA